MEQAGVVLIKLQLMYLTSGQLDFAGNLESGKHLFLKETFGGQGHGFDIFLTFSLAKQPGYLPFSGLSLNDADLQCDLSIWIFIQHIPNHFVPVRFFLL